MDVAVMANIKINERFNKIAIHLSENEIQMAIEFTKFPNRTNRKPNLINPKFMEFLGLKR